MHLFGSRLRRLGCIASRFETLCLLFSLPSSYSRSLLRIASLSPFSGDHNQGHVVHDVVRGSLFHPLHAGEYKTLLSPVAVPVLGIDEGEAVSSCSVRERGRGTGQQTLSRHEVCSGHTAHQARPERPPEKEAHTQPVTPAASLEISISYSQESRRFVPGPTCNIAYFPYHLRLAHSPPSYLRA